MSESPLARESYRGLSAAEFFYRNREIAGFSNPVRALYQTVRELVENSLDATELHGILPDLKVFIELGDKPDRVKVRVEDNGVGIPYDEIPNVFGRVFYGSKYVIKQSRGVFGLGIKMAVLYAQITTGTPIYVMSATPYSPVIAEYKLMIDISKNRPIILHERLRRKNRKWHGTIVELTIEGNWPQARRRVEEYIRRTAIITPYANIYFKSPDSELIFKRLTKVMPPPPKEAKPHPYGVDVEMLKMLIRSADKSLTLKDFISSTFEGVGEGIASNFMKWCKLNPYKKLSKLTLDDIVKLAKFMKEYPNWRRPRPLSLSPIGEDLLRRGIKEILGAEYVAAVTRKPSSYGGNPFVVEVALAWGGKIQPSDKPLLFRFANKIPLLYDEGADVSRKVIDNLDWSNYKVKFPAPLAVLVHVCSTKLPFKGVGKEAIADIPEIEKEISNALKECGRRLKAHITMVEKIHEKARRKVHFSKYIGEVARALSEITGLPSEKFADKLLKILSEELGEEVKVSEVH
ncbi:MAG: DNA topoisomerase VI subunit B [Thermofilum sp. ex4484_15]|nr:MAG: DNA topoisomerase VI subunit B [Thermofilum sp. ex4484_15]